MKTAFIQFKFINNTLLGALLLGVVIASCGKDSDPPPPPADKVALGVSITSAQGLVDNTVEGTKPGQYEVGSKAPLSTALSASKVVAADAAATQASVNNTTAQLDAAIGTYQSHLIKEIAAANLIGFWKMNGNANDSSGNSNNGVLTAGHTLYGAGTPTLTVDRFARTGMAYHFDKGGNIDVPYKTSLNPQQMSLSLWIKWSSTGRVWDPHTYTMIAMNRWNGYKFQLQDIHLPQFTVRVAPLTPIVIYDRATHITTPIAENTWRHLVVTFTSGVENYYIDGDLVATWDAASTRPVPGNPLTLVDPINFIIGQDLPTNKYLTVDGDFQVSWGGFFTGDMDDVMIYNIALDGPQVKSIFNNQKSL